MNFDEIESLSQEELQELYSQTIEKSDYISLTTKWHVNCSNGNRGYVDERNNYAGVRVSYNCYGHAQKVICGYRQCGAGYFVSYR